MRNTRVRQALAIVAGGAFFIACSKDSGSGPKSPGPPASLTIVSGDQQHGTVGTELPNPLVVKVVDANGNSIQGQAVNFRVTAGGGSVFAGTSNTNADGIAQERWTLGTVAGAGQTLEARAVDNSTGQALVFATFHATAVAEVAGKLGIVTHPSSSARSGRALDTVPVGRSAISTEMLSTRMACRLRPRCRTTTVELSALAARRQRTPAASRPSAA